MHLNTFSIVARDDRTKEFGVASATAIPCVGAIAPFVSSRGAIASQAWGNVNLGYHGLKLMKSEISVGSALKTLLEEDEDREWRQVAGVDKSSAFAFTGSKCDDAKGDLVGKDFAVAGNLLADFRVLEAMSDTYRHTKGEFARRLLASLAAGQDAGGDSRGKISACLLISSPEPKIYHNIRVDAHMNPVRELERVFESCWVLHKEFAEEEGHMVLKLVGDDR